MDLTDHAAVSRVWDRVLGTSAPQDPAFYCQARQAACQYAALACRIPSAAPALRRLCREKQAQARQLAALYYLQTGDCPHCPDTGAPDSCPCRALRAQITAEEQAARSYEAAAQTAGVEGPVLARLAAQNRTHARRLLCILAKLL